MRGHSTVEGAASVSKQVTDLHEQLPPERMKQRGGRCDAVWPKRIDLQVAISVRVAGVDRGPGVDQVGGQYVGGESLFAFEIDELGIRQHRVVIDDRPQRQLAGELITRPRTPDMVVDDGVAR